MNRRDWLKTAGGLVVGFTFGGVPAFGAQAVPASPFGDDGRSLDPKEVDSFLSIHPDGSVTVYTSKVDVGTGMRIAMAQMAAEELGVDTARITVVDGDTARCPNTGGTGGSTGLTRGGTAVRQAAATARQALLGLAATRLKRPAADLTIVAGEARPAAGGRGIPIGDLVGGRRLAVASGREGAARPSVAVREGWTVPAEARGPCQVHGPLSVHPGLQRSRHAPRPRDPAASCRCNARLGRRSLRRAASRRSRCPGRELPRGGLGRRVGSGAGVARTQGEMDRVARAAGARQPGALSARGRRSTATR